MTLLLDSGALVAVERANRDVVALIKRELIGGREPLTHGGVIGQVWRGGQGRQVNLSRLLPGIEVAALDERLGRQAGVLLASARKADVIDAALVVLATDGDEIVTSGPEDLKALATAAGSQVDLILA